MQTLFSPASSDQLQKSLLRSVDMGIRTLDESEFKHVSGGGEMPVNSGGGGGDPGPIGGGGPGEGSRGKV